LSVSGGCFLAKDMTGSHPPDRFEEGRPLTEEDAHSYSA